MDTTQIPRLELPSGGGWVEFIDLDDLTGADIHAIRRAVRQEDTAGQTTNAMLIEAIRVTVKTWDIGYLQDPRTPEANPAAWKKLKARDLRALEEAVAPVLLFLRAPRVSVDDQTPGSPTRPDSE